jgi:putative oxidoreductase
MFRKLLATAPTWMNLPLRLALGAIFIAHGGGKTFGWFGGKGLSAFLSNSSPPFEFMRPAWFWMGAAAISELLGGILVLAGLLTRLGALLIAFVMLTAMFGVHLKGGFFLPAGYEYTLALLGMALALIIAGGGQLSFDQKLASSRGRRR